MKHREMFYPGTVYLARGECHYSNTAWPFITDLAYKIGATSKTPAQRIRASKSEVWRFGDNLELIHAIPVDNMRVVELMFHRKLYKYVLVEDRNCEWFLLRGRKHAVTRYQSIRVADALCDLAQSDDVHGWWKGLDIVGRQDTALKLWKHPLTRVILRW